MTLAQVEYAEQRMKQQWHDLVMAEQAGASLEELEQMYDLYILLAQEYNACSEAYQHQKQSRGRRKAGKAASSAARPAPFAGAALPRQENKRNARLAS